MFLFLSLCCYYDHFSDGLKELFQVKNGVFENAKSSRKKIYKKYSIGNEEWIEFETETIIQVIV